MSFDLKLENGAIVLEGGDLKTVVKHDKLSQDLVKIIVTPVGSSSVNPWYGSALNEKVVGSSLSQKLQDQEIFNTVQFAVQNLKSLQERQANTGQLLSPSEQISKITNIFVERSKTDAREMFISVEIRTRDGEIITETLTARL
jgi:phage baseplate assembly protein W